MMCRRRMSYPICGGKMWRNFAIITITFIAVLWILLTPLNKLGRIEDERALPPQPGEVLTADKINAFLLTWSEFMSKDVSRFGVQQISLTDGRPGEKFSPQLIRWLDGQGWNVDRFFFIEQRLKAAVKTAALTEHLEANKKVLRQLRLNDASDSELENMKKIIARQEQQINAEKITDGELSLIKDNLYRINAILEGKEVVRP